MTKQTRILTIAGALLALLILAQCSEKTTAPIEDPQPPLEELVGSWLWLETMQAVPDGYLTPLRTGYQKTIIFTPWQEYLEYHDGSLYAEGTYAVELTPRDWMNDTVYVLTVDSLDESLVVRFLGTDTLELSSFFPLGCTEQHYLRLTGTL